MVNLLNNISRVGGTIKAKTNLTIFSIVLYRKARHPARSNTKNAYKVVSDNKHSNLQLA